MRTGTALWRARKSPWLEPGRALWGCRVPIVVGHACSCVATRFAILFEDVHVPSLALVGGKQSRSPLRRALFYIRRRVAIIVLSSSFFSVLDFFAPVMYTYVHAFLYACSLHVMLRTVSFAAACFWARGVGQAAYERACIEQLRLWAQRKVIETSTFGDFPGS